MHAGLKKIESVKARERQGKRNDLTSEKNFSNVERTSDIVAEKIGIGSGKQYEKEKYIVDNADTFTLKDFAEASTTGYRQSSILS